MLAGLVLLAALAAFAPRFEYPYPLHVDEWTHLAETRQLLDSGTVSERDAVTGESRGAIHPEFGFHVLLAGAQRATGMSLVQIMRLFPLFSGAALALGAWAFARGRGFGEEAALFAGFLPTTVRLLGPGLAVPAALGLAATAPVLLLLEAGWGRRWMPPALALVLSALFVTHPPSALLLAASALLLTATRMAAAGAADRRAKWVRARSVGVAVAVAAVPFVVLQHDIGARAGGAAETNLGLLDAWGTLGSRLGVPVLALFAIGLWRLAASEEPADRRQLWLTSAVALSVIVLAWWPAGPETLWSRAALYSALLILLAAARGFAWSWRALAAAIAARSRLGWPAAAAVSAAVLAIPVTALQLHVRFDEPYYRLVTPAQVARFAWAGNALCPGYDLALVDEVLSRPFAAISGRQVYGAIPLAITPGDSERLTSAREELAAGVPDADWLRARGISLVYSEKLILAADLIQVRPNLYVLPADEVCSDSSAKIAMQPRSRVSVRPLLRLTNWKTERSASTSGVDW